MDDDRLFQDKSITPRTIYVARHRSTAMAGRRETSMVLHPVEINHHQFVDHYPRSCFCSGYLFVKVRNSKKLQPDIVEIYRMREDDSRRNLKWLTERIDRLLARDRMAWARKLQRKSLTSGAIDSDAAPGAPGK